MIRDLIFKHVFPANSAKMMGLLIERALTLMEESPFIAVCVIFFLGMVVSVFKATINLQMYKILEELFKGRNQSITPIELYLYLSNMTHVGFNYGLSACM